MIIVRENTLYERRATIKRPPPIRNPIGAIAVFDQIDTIFSYIFIEFTYLIDIFISENWNLAESQKDSLSSYHKHAKEIRTHLTNIELLNAGLAQFLASEERPIPIKATVSAAIDVRTEMIGKTIKLYYDEVKGTMFPRFDEEIKRLKDIIEKVNLNIDRINEINVSHRRNPINHVKNLTI